MTLENKKILFFSPAFFGYESKIKEAMENEGAKVYYYDERSVSSPLSRALLKIAPWIFNGKTYRYYKRIVEENKETQFDYILIVRCDMVTSKIISLLRQSFPNAKLCLHLWDSIRNIKGIKNKINLFDFASSFDLSDCEKNHKLIFRPLFYTNDFCSKNDSAIYDLSFCGTIHTDRYFIVNSLINEANKNGLKTYAFAYLPSKFMFYYYKIFGKGWRKAKKSFFSFEKKSISEISSIEKQSEVILDVQHPKQTGLTMRTIEMIGANKKFITTNENVVKYDFYNSNNILIVGRKKPTLDLHFFKTPYEPVSEEIYKKYHIKQWVFDVLGI